MPAPKLLSVVIPLRGNHPLLDRCLAALVHGECGDDVEIIVATPTVEEVSKSRLSAGFRVIGAPLGRGACLSAGVREARGEWVLVLHADTVLSDGWRMVIRTFMETHADKDVAGYFRLRHDSPSFQSRCIETFVALRCALLALPYGDQGLLIRKAFYDRIGGYQSDFPIMEDVDIIRRIGRGRLRCLDVAAVTSAERYARGYARRVLRNLRCLALYFGGMHPAHIVKHYERA